MVITQGRRVAIRAAHVPTGGRGLCAVCHQRLPCDAIQLIDELEAVEAAARNQHAQLSEFRRRNAEVEVQMRRAVHELNTVIKGLSG
jgi:hypothetical protein